MLELLEDEIKSTNCGKSWWI